MRAAMLALAVVLGGTSVVAPAFAAGDVASGTSDTAPRLALVKPGDMKGGALLLPAQEDGRYVVAPLVATDVAVSISGPIARTVVTQRFTNPTGGWVEGLYVFPLPETSAVDTLKMRIGDRFIEGEIKPRGEARAIYEKAKQEGRKASLLEQERANLFTNSVANIGPGETIVVQIEYQETVRRSQGVFSLRVPLVVAPRYSPKPVVHTVKFDNDGGWASGTDPVPDRDRIDPPVLDPADNPKTNPVTLSVDIKAGFALGEVKSATHTLSRETLGDDHIRVTLADETVPADRDFELSWSAKADMAPTAGLFRERVDGKDYLLAFVMPPQVPENRMAIPPREMIFVVDTSGSMAGLSMAQARASLGFALDQLRPGDRFNIIRFSNDYEQLFPAAMPADKAHLDTAMRFVEKLDANGGTEMLSALQAAFVDDNAGDSSTVRQVVFLTDGAIGNETQLFEAINRLRGRSRVFTVGIGSAPNTFFMNRAAEIGRGTFTHIDSVSEVLFRMNELFAKLRNPVITDLQAEVRGGTLDDITPDALPDLYLGEPIVLTAQTETLRGTLALSGTYRGQPWRLDLPLAKAAEGSGIGKLWARRKIADLEIERAATRQPATIDTGIERVAMTHHLVSRKTSLVAVDVTPSRPAGEQISSAEVPLNLPHGWVYDKVFGGPDAPAGTPTDTGPRQPNPVGQPTPQRDAEAPAAEQAAYAKLAMARGAPNMAAPTGAGVMSLGSVSKRAVLLPQTATPADRKIIIGLVMLLFAAMATVVGMMWHRLAASIEAGAPNVRRRDW